jgi:Flp pilus assembly protein TadG
VRPTSRHGRGRGEGGQALVETALAFPLLVAVALGVLQLVLFAHAQHVVTAAVQDGARVAAAEDRTPGDGLVHAQALLRAGLGAGAGDVTLSADGDADAVVLEARGHLRLVIPWVLDAGLPLRARAIASKEGFRVPALRAP